MPDFNALQTSPSGISAPAGFPSPSFSARCWFWLCFRVPKESKSQETHVGFSGRVITFVCLKEELNLLAAGVQERRLPPRRMFN